MLVLMADAAASRLQLLSGHLLRPSAAAGQHVERRVRIAFGEYTEEADTFTRKLAGWADFEVNGIYEGAEMLDGRLDVASNSMLGGFLEVVQDPQQVTT